MNKEELLRQIQSALEEGAITQDDLRALTGTHHESAEPKSKFSLATILYYIGGGIVFMGIAVLIAQNWSDLNTLTRILSTLGASVAAYVSAVLFSNQTKTIQLSMAFYLLSGILLPLGLGVAFHEAGYEVGENGLQSLMALISAAVFFATYILKRNNLVLALGIIFSTWLFFAFSSYLVSGRPIFDEWQFIEYRVLLVGLTYLLLGYSFSTTPRKKLTGLLYVFGLLGFLFAALSLGRWSPEQNVFWEAIYPGLVFVVILLSIQLRSKAFLTLGSLFLMIYILKITAEYFTDSLGWPLALVIAGLVLMAIGYGSVMLNRKYLQKK